MEINHKNRAPTTQLVKHVQRGNFPMILHRILKNLLQMGHSTDSVQLTLVNYYCMMQKVSHLEYAFNGPLGHFLQSEVFMFEPYWKWLISWRYVEFLWWCC